MNAITPTQDENLTLSVRRAADALLRRRHEDGHWLFELEADATIPAEYVLLEHFLDRIDEELERKIGVYLRANQGSHGGWPLFHDGKLDLSCSVKAYYALRCIGDAPDAPHMARAREAILSAGGAESTNVFTRAQLALFGQVPWRAVPVMPLEIMHLPLWFPFHLSKVSYWSRTVIVPLLVLMALQPRARNPRQVQVPELFRRDPETIKNWIHGPYRSNWGRFFKGVDSLLRVAQPAFPKSSRGAAIQKAVAFVTERLNGEDGLGGIYPAIANSVMMFDTLGYSPDDPPYATAWEAVRKLLVVEADRAYCQPCLSPIWDTGLAGHAIAEAGRVGSLGLGGVAVGEETGLPYLGSEASESVIAGLGPAIHDFAVDRKEDLDSRAKRGHDDIVSSANATALGRDEREADASLADHVASACAWLRGRQITEVRGDWTVRRPALPPGGWAFQYWNDHYPDVDDTAVVGMLLHRQGDPSHAESLRRARRWIVGMQSVGGGRFDGGWGAFEPENIHLYLNHIPFADHGALLDPPTADVTARCVSFLAQTGMGADDPVIARAVAFLRREQEEDGSWFGRWGTNYIYGTWSVLCALNAVGLGLEDGAVRRAVDWLVSVQREDGGWGEDEESYAGAAHGRYKESTPSQTSWALLGLMAAGAVEHPAMARGIEWLLQTQREGGEWSELPYTAVGFPRVFYLRYHGYRLYFPLLALARYRNLMRGNERRVGYGF